MHDRAEHGGTDLGRRIRAHRERAGLTREQVADRAAMAANYLAYLETSLMPDPAPSALARLAAALGTTPSALAGAGLDLPPGQRVTGERPALEGVSAAACRGYLGTGGIGRFVFLDSRGPVAVPVNYKMLGDDIVIRTAAHTSLAAAADGRRVSFEVDHMDEDLAEGWSVLVSGEAHVVTEPAELSEVSSLGITPWAGGGRETYVRIVARELTGRRIQVR